MASPLYDRAMAAFGHFSAGYQRRVNTNIAVAGIAVASSLALAPFAYRDYKTYMGYGPGGTPHSVFGWLFVTLLFGPLKRDVLTTKVYDNEVDAAKGSWLPYVPQRQGDRPVVGPHAAPQRQLTQLPGDEIKSKLVAAFDEFARRNLDLIKVSPSTFEKHTDALYLADDLPESPVGPQREISHIHGTSDHSVHVTLSPADCKKVIQAGWGQRHPLDGSKLLTRLTGLWLPNEYMFIYAPRDTDEIETVMRFVRASVGYMARSDSLK